MTTTIIITRINYVAPTLEPGIIVTEVNSSASVIHYAGTKYELTKIDAETLNWLADWLVPACSGLDEQRGKGKLSKKRYEQLCAKYEPMRDKVLAEEKRRQQKHKRG